MNANEKQFYDIVKSRSEENLKSFDLLYNEKCYGNCVSILRQELDSYIRVLFVKAHPQKDVLIQQTLNNEKWKIGKQKITERMMLNYLNPRSIDAWEGDYIYKMGCFFVHLSNSHNYKNESPFKNLSQRDKSEIINFIKQRHSCDMDTTCLDIDNIETIIPFLPLIIRKISDNLEYNLEQVF